MPAQASLRVAIDGEISAAIDIGTVAHDFVFGPSYNFTDGTGADQIRQVFTDTRTLAASATEDLDLAGSLTNALGVSVVFTKIRGLLVRAAAANTNNVIVGGAAANQFATPFGAGTHTVTVRPGGLLLLVAGDATGYAVTAGTGDLLKIANSGGTTGVTYDIVLLGTA
jgi:hypothetical protein